MTTFKSDARPSDTKSVVLHRERDARLLAHVAQTKGESGFWRAAGYFLLDFNAWLATQPDAPEPGLPFACYRAWLESRLTPTPQPLAPIDPDSLASAILPAMREVIEAALSTALAGLSVSAGAPAEGVFELELAELFSGELVLE
jgi:hypothetical protein